MSQCASQESSATSTVGLDLRDFGLGAEYYELLLPNKKIYFVSGNENKLHEFRNAFGELWNVERIDIDLPELQSASGLAVVHDKVRCAMQHPGVKYPFFVEDTGLVFYNYLSTHGAFPGPLIKFVSQAVPYRDLCGMVKGNPTAVATCDVALAVRPGVVRYYSGRTVGVVPREPDKSGFGWDVIFQVLHAGRMEYFSRMDSETKARYSPRGKVVKNIRMDATSPLWDAFCGRL